MGKRDDYARKIQPLLAGDGPFEALESLLLSECHLPGPRGNLELAAAFADIVEASGAGEARWALLHRWAGISLEEAPTGDPGEFLPFCALQALGALYLGAEGESRGRIVARLRAAAGDGRWRVREGAAMALQRVAERDFGAVRALCADWMQDASLAERRALVAALAHPPALKDAGNALFCLEMAEWILADLVTLSRESRKSEEFRILRMGLEYALSVFVAHLPGPGFAFLTKWAVVDDADVRRIVQSNLGKARLAKKHGREVAEVLALLQS